jgi:hypothetical protein
MFEGDRRYITRAQENATGPYFQSHEPNSYPHVLCYYNYFQFIFVYILPLSPAFI